MDSNYPKFPIIKQICIGLDKIIIPFMDEVTLYQLIRLYLKGLSKGVLTLRASAISFSLFMALFPFLLFLFSLLPQLPMANELIETFEEDILENVFSLESLKKIKDDILMNEITDINKNNNIEQKGGVKIVPFLLTLFFASNGMGAIINGFRSSYFQRISIGFINHYIRAIGLTLLLTCLLLSCIFFILWINIYLGRWVDEEGHLSDYTYQIIDTLIYLGLGLLAFFSIFIIYKVGMTVEKGTKKKIMPGTILTFVLFVGTIQLFQFYVGAGLAKQNVLYGSIGTVILLMLWIYINVIILLTGHELNMVLSQHKVIFTRNKTPN